MFSNGRKTIGVFAENVTLEFQNNLCQGIMKEAKNGENNIAVFSNYGNYGQNNLFFKGDRKVYTLPPYEEFAGVILALDTMQQPESREVVLENVMNRCRCPIVSVRERLDGVNNFLVDNSNCVEGIIRHFVEVHGFTKLCFMTGPEDRWDAIERLNCFQKMMDEYQLPVDEHQIFYGDFWTNKGREACDWFLADGRMPEAIVCANDYMATAVVSELIGRGYSIPDDICVSGYDGMKDAIYFTPSISTMRLPFRQMGVDAVKMIRDKEGHPEDIEDRYYLPELFLHESCGCMKEKSREVFEARRVRHEEMRTEHNRELQFNFMAVHMGEYHTIEQVGAELGVVVYNIPGFKDYCLCLCEDVITTGGVSDFTDTMHMRIASKDRESMGTVDIQFDRNELLPREITGDEPQMWYFTPMHYQDKIFGYEATSFMTPEVTGQLFRHWNIVVSNKIQDIIIHHKMQLLIEELENMYDRDSLTGIYNRRGLDEKGSDLFVAAKKDRSPVFFAMIDMDGMKQINDNYGHPAGDAALKTLCAAIESRCVGDHISARSGGDEFVIIARDITEAEGLSWLEGVTQYLEDYNEHSGMQYNVHASYGYMWGIPGDGDSIETYMRQSDEMMYVNKVNNKKRRGEPLR